MALVVGMHAVEQKVAQMLAFDCVVIHELQVEVDQSDFFLCGHFADNLDLVDKWSLSKNWFPSWRYGSLCAVLPCDEL